MKFDPILIISLDLTRDIRLIFHIRDGRCFLIRSFSFLYYNNRKDWINQLYQNSFCNYLSNNYRCGRIIACPRSMGFPMKRIISRINNELDRIDRCNSQIEYTYLSLSLFLSSIQPRCVVLSRILEYVNQARNERPIKFFINIWKRIICTWFSYWNNCIISFLLFFPQHEKFVQARYKINEGKKDFSNIESRLLYSTIIVQRSRNDPIVIRFTVSSFSIRSSVLNDPRDNDNIRIIDRGSFRISYTYTVYLDRTIITMRFRSF